MQHAFGIEAGAQKGTAVALEWIERELGLRGRNNPDIVLLTFGLFSVDDARRVVEIAAVAPVASEKKAVIIVASRAYHEAQNALLKLFEEPPQGVYLFFVLPTLGNLLPTLRSRIHVLALARHSGSVRHEIDEVARQFLLATREKRSTIAKRLASGKNDEERRAHRDEALAVVNGIEAAVYTKDWQSDRGLTVLLEEIQEFRMCFASRSAPTRMILEHLAIVVPSDLL